MAEAEQEDQDRLLAAVDTVSGDIRAAALLATVVSPVALVRINEGDRVAFKLVTRDEAARQYSHMVIVQRLLARPVEAALIPVIAYDSTRDPTPFATARVFTYPQKGGVA